MSFLNICHVPRCATEYMTVCMTWVCSNKQCPARMIVHSSNTIWALPWSNLRILARTFESPRDHCYSYNFLPESCKNVEQIAMSCLNVIVFLQIPPACSPYLFLSLWANVLFLPSTCNFVLLLQGLRFWPRNSGFGIHCLDLMIWIRNLWGCCKPRNPRFGPHSHSTRVCKFEPAQKYLCPSRNVVCSRWCKC